MAGLCNTSHILTLCHKVSVYVSALGDSVAHFPHDVNPIIRQSLSTLASYHVSHCISARHTGIYLTGRDSHNRGLMPH